MSKAEHPSFCRRFRKGDRLLLAICWCFGFICGILAFFSAETFLLLQMHMSSFGSMSIVGLLCITLLPFLLSAYAVLISRPAWLFLICFCKAFFYSFVSILLMQCYGSAGWLIRVIFLFNDFLAVPVLYLFWLRSLSHCTPNRFLESTLFYIAILLIGSIDYYVVFPLFAGLLS